MSLYWHTELYKSITKRYPRLGGQSTYSILGNSTTTCSSASVVQLIRLTAHKSQGKKQNITIGIIGKKTNAVILILNHA